MGGNYGRDVLLVEGLGEGLEGGVDLLLGGVETLGLVGVFHAHGCVLLYGL